ncbi:hypothetical protein [Amycolatopsis australiensis]|uniref:non-homologous end-joining DNA ligase LigD n=1 Tax=Amycolatopsis australiensis TaxID=546364 RepID=UPI003183209D
MAPYSLSGHDAPAVSTPITWDEVRACRHAVQLVFTAEDVLDRLGDRAHHRVLHPHPGHHRQRTGPGQQCPCPARAPALKRRRCPLVVVGHGVVSRDREPV